ncbi:GNAT family N-acetyltransferase [Jannaschia sp. LMIT008]|uniref:GNAT family N-acetyltransferase n=1 Tax=Jannaschia maritima TaxID=3032585 RepID=UPI002811BB52|nr:GNAT family N-acetyltransferase [Jannaschia sp. LMIT008]
MIPTLTTPRLTLRAQTMADWPSYRDFYREQAAADGEDFDPRRAWTLFASDIGHWALHGFGWLILDDGTGAVGACGIHHPPQHADVEIGWNTFAAARGKGYAPEAATRVLEWGRGLIGGDTRLVSYITRGNAASEAVARKIGAADTGTASDHSATCNVWEHLS